MEAEFRRLPGIVATAVGYTGGRTDYPTYAQVCGGGTGHTEAVLVEFDPNVVSYDKLLEAFWSEHSPTHERKSQYRSVVFTYGEDQVRCAEESKAALEKKLGAPISTKIEPARRFWLAEDYHQQYFEKAGLDTCGIR